MPVELDAKALKPLRANLASIKSGLGEWELVKLWSASAQLTGDGKFSATSHCSFPGRKAPGTPKTLDPKPASKPQARALGP